MEDWSVSLAVDGGGDRPEMQYRALSYATRSGSTAADLYTLRAARPATIVMAHGAGNDRRYSFEPFITEALRRGFRVVSLDLPGHGAGQTSVLDPASAIEEFTEAVEAALATGGLAGSPYMLVGNSLGGVLAVRAVLEGRLRPLACLAIAMPARLALTPWAVLQEGRSLPALMAYRRYVARWWQVFPAFGPFRRAEFPVRVAGKPYLDVVAEIVNRPWSPTPQACPIKFLQGGQDAIARRGDTEALAAQLRGYLPSLEVSFVDGVGHLDVMVDPRTLRQALDWLEAGLGRPDVAAAVGPRHQDDGSGSLGGHMAIS